jgi:hypothetical protein
VVGVSRDSLKSHEGFKAKLGLPFDLISDIEGVLCRMFDVVKNKMLYGKKVLGIERSTFLIDATASCARNGARPRPTATPPPYWRRCASCNRKQGPLSGPSLRLSHCPGWLS